MHDALADWLALIRAPGIGAVKGAKLLEHCGTPEAVLSAGRSVWASCGMDEAVSRWFAQPDWALINQDMEWLAAQPYRHLITRDDPAYPARLKEIAAAPLALFVVGDPDVLQTDQIAIVGSRNASRDGLAQAHDFSAELARHGLVVTSGLALGIDTAAHEGALDSNGLTLAVCGTGPDRIYPARNRTLAEKIIEEGALVTEFPPGTEASARHFPQRNRLISGLSLGVLVVEAALQSGSLITARKALEQGREVFAMPGSIHNPMARGCHRLIREGAKLVETAADVLEELGDLVTVAPRESRLDLPNSEPQHTDNPSIDASHRQLLKAMGFGPVSVNEMTDSSGLTVEAVSSMLLILELEGHVEQRPGGIYQRCR